MLVDGPEGQSLPAGTQASRTQTVVPTNSPQSGIMNQTKLDCSCSVEPTRTITNIGFSSYHSIVSFMYIYSYLICLYWCKDYCHRVSTQFQLVIIIIIIIIIIKITYPMTGKIFTSQTHLLSVSAVHV